MLLEHKKSMVSSKVQCSWQCDVFSMPCLNLSVLGELYFSEYALQCNILSTSCSVQYAVFSVQYTVFSVQYTMISLHYTVFSVQ